ncbi:carbohydrate-binding module family 48 protein [Calycina marina]|uniref:Carbohydrate-binding module family 48 protein n=1 Tax=Calycina marina TaxID=1763456 RepID=A0A9P7YZF9_9HELO|nr:carbohydrate-binding module family 48 protein [Calycina marina]
MGSFVFKWDHPAEEVFVTGTFDGWQKSEKLEKTGSVFSKDVQLKNAEDKIYYKFVVDGNWVTDHTAPIENDASGNPNNYLTSERIVKNTTPTTAGFMSSAAAGSTTAGLAGKVPLEKAKSGSSALPGAFPETPGLETGQFAVAPLPATDGAANPIKLAPGEKVPHPSEFTSNTLTSGVHDDPGLVAADKAKGESEQTFSVTPLPAFAGGVNPIKSTPGESLPHSSSLTKNTILSGVRTDKESYENSGGLGTAPFLPNVVTPQAERDANGTGLFDLPHISKNMIPESSLPMGAAGGSYDASPFLHSAGAHSTTAKLAGAVPLESSKVPEVVKESQEKAGVDPEASAVPAEVTEKSAVEKELLKQVPVAPTTAEGTAGKETPDKTEKPAVTVAETAAALTGAAAALGGAAYAYAQGAAGSVPAYAQSAAKNIPDSVTSNLPASIQKSIADINGQQSVAPTEVAQDTPAIVKGSIAEAGQSPKAAGNEEAVLEKKAVESELLKEIMPETATGESAPAITQSSVAPTEAAKDTPAVVKESIAESGKAPEAAGNEEAVLEKKAVEKELLKEVKPNNSTGESAPAATLAAPTTPSKLVESRDVSPGTIPGSHATPVVTTGLDSKTVEPTSAAPATPAKSSSSKSPAADSPASTNTAEKKKKNRISAFFGKLKHKSEKN